MESWKGRVSSRMKARTASPDQRLVYSLEYSSYATECAPPSAFSSLRSGLRLDQAVLNQQLLQLARLVHLQSDVATADKFTLDVELGDGRPRADEVDGRRAVRRGSGTRKGKVRVTAKGPGWRARGGKKKIRGRRRVGMRGKGMAAGGKEDGTVWRSEEEERQ